VVVRNHALFDQQTADFRDIMRSIPRAPRLLYLVFDTGMAPVVPGRTPSPAPFVHLPAYVQADRGGWVSFHFARWDVTPVTYRDPSEPGAVVPPKMPVDWEWTPWLFDVRVHGAFFDWFLVRRHDPPDALFAADPSIVPVDHAGTWWLFRRSGPSPRNGR
jgi:hypothetical protein